MAETEGPTVACSWCGAESELERVSLDARVSGEDGVRRRETWALREPWREVFTGKGSRRRFACDTPCASRIFAVGSLLETATSVVASFNTVRDALRPIIEGGAFVKTTELMAAWGAPPPTTPVDPSSA